MKAKATSRANPARKPEAVAPRAAGSLSHDQIAAAARELWEKRGRPEGQDAEIWFEAERILREHLNLDSADEAMDIRSDEALRSASEPRPRNSGAL